MVIQWYSQMIYLYLKYKVKPSTMCQLRVLGVGTPKWLIFIWRTQAAEAVTLSARRQWQQRGWHERHKRIDAHLQTYAECKSHVKPPCVSFSLACIPRILQPLAHCFVPSRIKCCALENIQYPFAYTICRMLFIIFFVLPVVEQQAKALGFGNKGHHQQTTNNPRPTTHHRQPTTHDRQPTTNSRQPIANQTTATSNVLVATKGSTGSYWVKIYDICIYSCGFISCPARSLCWWLHMRRFLSLKSELSGEDGSRVENQILVLRNGCRRADLNRLDWEPVESNTFTWEPFHWLAVLSFGLCHLLNLLLRISKATTQNDTVITWQNTSTTSWLFVWSLDVSSANDFKKWINMIYYRIPST